MNGALLYNPKKSEINMMDHIVTDARLRKMEVTILLNSGIFTYFLAMEIDVEYTADKTVHVLYLNIPKIYFTKIQDNQTWQLGKCLVCHMPSSLVSKKLVSKSQKKIILLFIFAFKNYISLV